MNDFSATKKSQLWGLIIVTFTVFLDNLIGSLIVPIIPAYAAKLGASQTTIGLLFSCFALSLLITTPFWGIISDRIGRRIPMMLGLIGFVVSTIFFAFASNISELFTARIFQGISSAASWSTGIALLADLYPQEKRGRAMGFVLTSIAVGSLLGSPIGGVLYDLGGHAMPFLIVAGLAVVDLLAFVLLVKMPNFQPQQKNRIIQFLRNREVLIISLIVVIANSILAILDSIFPIFLEKNFNATSTSIGLMFGAATLSYGISSSIAGRLSDKLKHSAIMIVGLTCMSLTLPLLVTLKSLYFEIAAMTLVGASIGFAISPTLPAVAKLVDENEGGFYATAYAIFDIFFALGMIIGPIIGGIMTDTFGLRVSIFILSIILLFTVIALILKNNLYKQVAANE